MQHGKIPHKDERMLYSKKATVADPKQQKM